MTFTHLDTGPLDSIYEERVDGKRHYKTPDGNLYPSVTTVINHEPKPEIEIWKARVGEEEAKRIVDRSNVIGTDFHSMCEMYLNNELPYFNYMESHYHFMNIKSELDKINNISAQEVPLFSHELRLAGKVDLIADYDGVRSIIDFKTTRKKKRPAWVYNYFLQETAYSLMWEHMTDEKIERIVTLMTGEDGSQQTFIRNRSEYIEPLYEVRSCYDVCNWLGNT